MPKLETPREKAGDRVRRQILDHAEALFAERGFFGSSVRDLTTRAGVRLAAINYHFGTKEELFRSVLMRRAEALGAERLERLAKVPKRGQAAARTRAIVSAFTEPVLARAMAGDPGWRNYFALIAQTGSSRLFALELVADAFNRVALAFVVSFGEVFPRASRRTLHHAYQLMLAATLYTFADNRRLDSLTSGRIRSDDFAAQSEDLIEMLSAGLFALCAKPARARSAPRADRARRPRKGSPRSAS